jgi:putative transport protein
MNWLNILLSNDSVARSVILLAVAGASGAALGKLRIKGVGLGVAGVLFAGLVLGHFKLAPHHQVLDFVREFGLILFVYTLGLQIGPGFFASLRSRGLVLNGFAAVIVLSGALIAAGLIATGQVPLAAGSGLLSGATTNTPSLAAAGEALKQVGAAPETSVIQGLAYAIAYPFGIIGIIVTMLLVKAVFRVDVAAEILKAEALLKPKAQPPSGRNFEVRHPNLIGQRLDTLPGLVNAGVVISRFSRGGLVTLARPETELALGDVLHAVGPADALDSLRVVVGEETGVDLKALPGNVINRRLLVTQSAVLGRTLADLTTLAENNVVVTRVNRQAMEFTASAGFRLQFGDLLMVVGEEKGIAIVTKVVGNSPKALDHPQPIPFFIGIALGVLVGSVPLVVPGLPAPVKLGLAGGPLLVAILIARLANTGSLIWHMPPSANLAFREIGITLFLAAVGIKSGEKFLDVLLAGDGVRWLLCGALITFVPLIVVGLLARAWKKLNYAELCGLLAGSMTDPPALAFAQQSTQSDTPAVAYASVYPFVMLLRVFTAQLLIFLLWRSTTSG